EKDRGHGVAFDVERVEEEEGLLEDGPETLVVSVLEPEEREVERDERGVVRELALGEAVARRGEGAHRRQELPEPGRDAALEGAHAEDLDARDMRFVEAAAVLEKLPCVAVVTR